MLSTTTKIIWVVLIIELYVHVVQPGDVKISALFGQETSRDNQYKSVIEDGIRYINRNKTFLSDVHTLMFVGGSNTPSNSVYSALDEVCDHISSERMSAFILPEDKCPQCDDIAGISSHASNPIFSLDHGSFESGSIAFKMHPSPEDMNAFYIDIMHYFNWLNFVLVYDDDKAYENLEGMLNEASLNRWNITVVKLGNNLMDTVDNLIEQNNSNIFIYCSSEVRVRDLMNEALRVLERGEESPVSSKYHWIVGNLDLAMEREFYDSLEDSNVYLTRFTMNYTREHQYALPTSINTPINEWPLRERLAFDAVIAVGHALKTYRLDREKAGNTGTSVLPGDTAMPNCPTSATTPADNDLTDHLREVSFEGVTGNVAFDGNGNRANYTITIFSGQAETLSQMRGDWVQSIDFWEAKWQKRWENEGRLNVTYYQHGHDRVIRIVSVLAQPFLFNREEVLDRRGERRNKRQISDDATEGVYKGNDRFEGYIMDLLDRVKTHVKGLDFDYEVELVPDGQYGIKKRYSDIWTGMIGEVVRKKVDIAAGPLTVTEEREDAVDFTYPFMSSGIQMLIKHPKKVQHNPFRLFFVFGIEVWFINLIVFLLVSVLLFVFNYFDPYEWKAIAERGEADEENAGNFGCLNSMWFLTTTLFLQSFDKSPRSNAGRCLASFWWIFVLIMVFLYLTNLSFFVNTTKRLALVKTPHDLLQQIEVSYGVVKEGATYDFFWKSPVPEYQRIWQHMNTDKPVPYVNSVAEGVDRVRKGNGNYAFIGESGELSYRASQKPCDLLVAGGILSRTSYALAVQKGSPLAAQLSSAIETLRDTGVLEDLQREWWDLDEPSRYRCANLTEYEREAVFSMSANDLQGTYYMLLIGIGFSLLMFIADFVCKETCTGKPTRSVRNGGPSSGMGGGMPIGGGIGSGSQPQGGGEEKMWI
ncbi:glutamate receptor 2-like [Amphiura filiformis]|uniref:glutamate receptor 2-like n=1 Tax=Amphiura filiformis TaxID=82378 RepID=UPI003B220446